MNAPFTFVCGMITLSLTRVTIMYSCPLCKSKAICAFPLPASAEQAPFDAAASVASGAAAAAAVATAASSTTAATRATRGLAWPCATGDAHVIRAQEFLRSLETLSASQPLSCTFCYPTARACCACLYIVTIVFVSALELTNNDYTAEMLSSMTEIGRNLVSLSDQFIKYAAVSGVPLDFQCSLCVCVCRSRDGASLASVIDECVEDARGLAHSVGGPLASAAEACVLRLCATVRGTQGAMASSRSEKVLVRRGHHHMSRTHAHTLYLCCLRAR